MPISHLNKTIFIHIPKTGGETINKTFGVYGIDNEGCLENSREILYGVDNGKALQHLTASEVKTAVGSSIYNEYFKFSIVRNPFDKLVSEYYWRKKEKIISLETSFDYFIKNYLSKNYSFTNDELDYIDHFYKQIDYLEINGNISVDKVFRFEDFNSIFNFLSDRFNRDLNFIHLNNTQHSTYQSYYTNELIEIVNTVYKDDLEAFNYSFSQV